MENSWIKRNKWIFVAGPLALAAFIALFGEVTMLLWNWLAPMLFGWRHITFWQPWDCWFSAGSSSEA